MTIWEARAVGLETGRSAHHEDPMPGAAAMLLAGRAIGFWLDCQGRKKDMKRHCTRSQEVRS
jgi:hypothetical protein